MIEIGKWYSKPPNPDLDQALAMTLIWIRKQALKTNRPDPHLAGKTLE